MMSRIPWTKRARRRLLAEARNMRLVWREFRWPLAAAAAVWLVAMAILHEAYPIVPGDEPLSWGRTAYYVLEMSSFNTGLTYHNGMPWPVAAVFFVLPLLGLFVITNTIVGFLGLVFQRRLDQKEWQRMLASTYSHHVVVCGLGHVGFRIVQQLLAADEEVVAIERDSPFMQEVIALGVPVLQGDARQELLLKQAGVAKASAVLVTTNDDLANLDIGLSVRELNPGARVVLRMFDTDLARKIETAFGFDAVFSASALAAPVFAAAATARNVINSFVVDAVVLNTVSLIVRDGSALAGRSIDGVRAELGLTFLQYQHGATHDFNPSPQQVLAAGSRILVVATADALKKLEGLNLGSGVPLR